MCDNNFYRGIKTLDDFLKMIECYYDDWAHGEGLISDDVQSVIDLAFELYEKMNQPLKFKDLKRQMWAWDNKDKMYVQLEEDFDNGNDKKIIVSYPENSREFNCKIVNFEEDRFYRYEIKE